MSELLAWLRDLLGVPSVVLGDERSCVSGSRSERRVWVFLDDLTVEGVREVLRSVVDPQEVVLTPEALLEVLPGEEATVGGCPARVCAWPGDRAVWVGRRGPEVAFGECAVGEVEEVLRPFQSGVVVLPHPNPGVTPGV